MRSGDFTSTPIFAAILDSSAASSSAMSPVMFWKASSMAALSICNCTSRASKCSGSVALSRMDSSNEYRLM